MLTHCHRARVAPASEAGVDAESHPANFSTPHHAKQPAAVTIAAPRSRGDGTIIADRQSYGDPAPHTGVGALGAAISAEE
jgi:hypothetical protein